MLRYLVVIEKDGVRSAHGTAIWAETTNVFITSKPIGDDMSAKYFISRDGTMNEDVLRVVDFADDSPAAPGIPVASIEPYVYQLKLEETR